METTNGTASTPPGIGYWTQAPLAELTDYIRSEHHAYTRLALRRLLKLSFRAREAGELLHPELASVQRTIAELAADLVPHMLREEETLFPFVERLESVVEGRQKSPADYFGSTREFLAEVNDDHAHEGRILGRLRTLTCGFAAPTNATVNHAALVSLLREFAERLEEHMKLESLLLSRANKLERRGRENYAACFSECFHG